MRENRGNSMSKGTRAKKDYPGLQWQASWNAISDTFTIKKQKYGLIQSHTWMPQTCATETHTFTQTHTPNAIVLICLKLLNAHDDW